MAYNLMPRVTYSGQTYVLRSRATVVPDLESMDRIDALIWLNVHATNRGYQKPRPLIAATVAAA